MVRGPFRPAALLAPVVAVAVAVAGCTAERESASDTPDRDEARPSALSSVAGGAVVLVADLTPAQVVPGPGDQDASGTVVLTPRPGEGRVCAVVEAMSIGKPVGAHVHRGGPGEGGPLLFSLPLPAGGEPGRGCVDVEAAVLDGLQSDPARFFVVLRTREHLGGAVRGQVREGTAEDVPPTQGNGPGQSPTPKASPSG